MKKLIPLILSALLISSSGILYAGALFTLTPPVIQNMVVGSSQNLSFTLANQTPGTVNVHCSFISDNQLVNYSFNDSGCTSPGGLGLPSSPNTIPVVLTLNVPSGVSGVFHGTLAFQQTNGRGALSPPQIFPITITVKPNSDRTITFENYCPFNVYLGLSSGNAPAKNTGNIACSSDADCAAYTFASCVNGACGGGACNQNSDCAQHYSGDYSQTCHQPAAGKPSACQTCYGDDDCILGSRCNLSNHQCYWNMPTPEVPNYQLAPYSGASPATNSIKLTDYSAQNGYSLVWTGRAAGRTDCQLMGTAPNQYYACQTADCNSSFQGTAVIGDGLGGCGIAQSFAAPSTLLEFALVGITPDTYDVSMVNGVSIPASMTPSSSDGIGSPEAYANPFTCGGAGNIRETDTSNGNLGACTWDFSPPSVAFRLVDGTNGSPCSSDSYCITLGSNLRCGQTFQNAAITTTTATLTCGLPLGYWNQNQFCTITGGAYNVTNVVNCPEASGGGNSVYNLLQGTGNAATSCYSVGGLTNTCAGCTNWQDQGIIMPSNNDIVQQCAYPNSNWGAGIYPNATGAVLPGITWLKQACPSAYSYVFDDKASTFGCPANNGQSAVNYTITLCPGGKTAGSTGGA